MGGEKVALIGSGNWGSAIATKMGINAAACGDFEDTIMMCATPPQGCCPKVAVSRRRPPGRPPVSPCLQVGV